MAATSRTGTTISHAIKPCAVRAPTANSKRVARQKGRHDQARFAKNDQKKQRINQCAIVLDEGDQMVFRMQEELEKLLQQIHKELKETPALPAMGSNFAGSSRVAATPRRV